MSKPVIWILAVVAGPVLSFLVGYGTGLFAPQMSQDVSAYSMLIDAAGCEDLQAAINYAEQAENTAADPKIQAVANSVNSIYGIYLQIGIKTKSESESLMGDCKALIAGASNPLFGAYLSAQLLYYGYGLDDKIGELDSIYSPQRIAYKSNCIVVKWGGRLAYWVILLGFWWFLYQSYKTAK
jgi:hypothetical protein